LSEEGWMLGSDTGDNSVEIVWRLDVYETGAVFLDSRESMEVLDEVLACFHHAFAFFVLPEEITMFSHGREYLAKCWFVVSWEKTPRIPK
jgi:hypothetical protein